MSAWCCCTCCSVWVCRPWPHTSSGSGPRRGSNPTSPPRPPSGARYPSAMLRARVVLSERAWDAVRLRYGVAEQHTMLSRVAGPDPDEDELDRIGPALAREIAEAITLVARPVVELHGHVGDKVFVAATNGHQAVLAATDGSRYELTPIATDKLIPSTIDLLPARPAGQGEVRRFPLEALEPLSRDIRAGRFSAARRDHLGRRRQSRCPVTVADAESGRWLLTHRESWTVVTPGTRQQLRALMTELLRQVH
ncbi:ESX secretion-associated protein EspG [Pseudonocardiaceae bacterium YIM PH 21723]|nr:ESX secretion-associated protein EspG [Pseudonocardiaceae bacterium YIM PH 21723]